MSKVFFILSFLLSNTVRAAETCGAVDLRSQFGAVRNQGDNDNCYAFMAADLLGTTLPNPSRQQISTLHISANYLARSPHSIAESAKQIDSVYWAEEDGPRQMSRNDFKSEHGMRFEKRLSDGASTIGAVVAESMGKPLCLEDELPSQVRGVRKGEASSFTKNLGAGKKYEDHGHQVALRTLRLNDSLAGRPEELAELDEKTKNKNQILALAHRQESLMVGPPSPNGPKKIICLDQTVVEPFPDLNPKKGLIAAVFDWSTVKVAETLSDSCHNKVIPPKKRIRQLSFDYGDAGANFKLLDQQLDKKIPLGINYNVCYFQRNADVNGDCAHASLVVGRRRNKKTGSCEYLIRNSWGTSCSGYKKGTRCEDGNYWASEKDLKKSLGGFGWIDDPR